MERTVALVAFTLTTSVLLAAAPMESKKPAPAGPAGTELCPVDPSKSACGLPSQVVIDMSAARIKKTDAEWKKLLTPRQFEVTRKQGTEPPFANEYWNHHEDGVYFSVCSETPLFDSRDKFDSGTGWPSFVRPLQPEFIGVSRDTSHGMIRDEVHCKVDGSHLGHVFDDGPAPTRKRYCINSASLRFMPRKEYEAWVTKNSTAVAAVKP